jgi:hypothetical protein
MIEIPNSFDLMTNMHHTNPQLVGINSLNQQNVQLKKSNAMWKFVGLGLLILSLVAVYKLQREQQDEKK